MPASPHDRFVQALEAGGWTVTSRSPLGSGPNPTRVDIRRGRLQRHLLVYAWRVTGEGKGRKRQGRSDLDYRIQTTRSHDGPLLTPSAHLACGIGWDEEREVFAAFDPWVQRNTGRSSSVHFTREMLDHAAQLGTAGRAPADHGPQVAFRPEQINAFLGWALALQRRRLVALDPEAFDHDGERAVIRVDPWSEPKAKWLRKGDHVVLRRKGSPLDDSVWRIEELESEVQATESGRYNRTHLILSCRRYGVIRDPDWLKELDDDVA